MKVSDIRWHWGPLAGITEGSTFDAILYRIRSTVKVLLLTGNDWDIVLHGHISWRAHVNIIDWRSLECQICNLRYCKIPKIRPAAYIFQRPFLRGLSTEGNLCFKIDWASLIVGSKFTFFALLYFVFEGNFPSTSPQGLILEGRFNRGFFALPIWGAYIWRGLFLEFYGICRPLAGFGSKNTRSYNFRSLASCKLLHLPVSVCAADTKNNIIIF